MRIKAALSDTEIDRGFANNQDHFSQRDLALRLTSLYDSLEHSTVALLDGRWGIGKTTFARRWVAHLRGVGIPAIYFDAFASDYIESPFEAVAGAFVKAAAEAGRTDNSTYRNFVDRAAKVGKAVAGAATKIGVKAATLGVIGAAEIEQLNSVKDDIADALSGASEQSIRKLLESHAEREADFSALKTSLTELPSLLRPASVSEAESRARSLVVVIDELDRCRPDFALGVVETLKHFFRVDNIHFILVTNRSHLALSVAHRYGSGSAADEYLEKFYDFIVYFDQDYTRYGQGNIGIFVADLAAKLLPAHVDGVREIPEYVASAARAFRLSLRQIEAVFTNIALAYVVVQDREFRPSLLVTFLVLMKTLRPDLYRKAKAATLQSAEVAAFLDQHSWDQLDIERVNRVFRYHLEAEINENDEEWRGYGSSLFQFNIERHRVIPYLANSVLDRFGRGQDAG